MLNQSVIIRRAACRSGLLTVYLLVLTRIAFEYDVTAHALRMY